MWNFKGKFRETSGKFQYHTLELIFWSRALDFYEKIPRNIYDALKEIFETGWEYLITLSSMKLSEKFNFMIYSYVWLFARLTGVVSETFQEVLRTFSKYLSISENFWVYDLKFIISMILCLLDQQIFWNHFSQIIWINSRLLQLFFLSNPILFSSSFFAGV